MTSNQGLRCKACDVELALDDFDGELCGVCLSVVHSLLPPDLGDDRIGEEEDDDFYTSAEQEIQKSLSQIVEPDLDLIDWGFCNET